MKKIIQEWLTNFLINNKKLKGCAFGNNAEGNNEYTKEQTSESRFY